MVKKLFKKSIIILALLLVSLFAVSAVSAEDNMTSEVSVFQESSLEDITLGSDDLSGINNLSCSDENNVLENSYSDDFYYVYIPDEVYKVNPYDDEDEEFMSFEFYDDASGDVVIKINDDVIYENHVSEDYYSIYNDKIRDLEYGTYNLNFNYNSDDGIHDSFSINQKFNVSYRFRVYIASWDYDEYDEVSYGNDLLVDISTPVSAGTITYVVNGKNYSVDYDNLTYDDEWGNCIVIPYENLKMGENSLSFSYIHSDFPKKTINKDLTVVSRIEIDGWDMAYDDIINVTLVLPGDAKGSLEVWDSETLIENAPLVNGFANIALKNLQLGEHNIIVKYTGQDYEVDELDEMISVDPKIIKPNKVWRYGDYSIVFELPSNYNGVLTLTINGQSKSTRLVNGKANIGLFDLESASYGEDEDYSYLSFSIKYVDDNNGYEFDRLYGVRVSDISPNVELTFRDDDTILRDYDDYSSKSTSYHVEFINLPEYLYGDVEVLIDGIFAQKFCIDEEMGETSFGIDVNNLTLGKHDVEFKYLGNSYYLPATAKSSFNVVDIIVDTPDEVVIEGYDTEYIKIYFNKHVSGNITILIDEKEVKNYVITPAYYGDSFYFKLDDLSIGTHKIEVKYSGDGIHNPIDEVKNVDVSYNISINANWNYWDYGDEDEDVCYIADNEIINICLPYDATNNITVNVDGKSIIPFYDGEWGINVSSLGLGNHKLEVTYPGDEKYPKIIVSKEFEVRAKIIIVTPTYPDDEAYVSLKLPADATGSLYMYFDDYETIEVPVVNGVAYYSLSNYKWGSYYVSAFYRGSDYKVIRDSSYFEIQPKITFDNETSDSFYLLINESDVNFDVLVPNDARGNLIVKLDGNDYGRIPFVNGKASVNIKNLKLGEHVLRFSYDEYEFDCERYVHVYPLDESYLVNIDDIYTMTLPKDAKGDLLLSLNGKNYTAKFINGVATINPDLKFGWNWGVIYYNGDDYGPYEDLFSCLIKPVVSVGHNDDYSKVHLTPIGGATPHYNISVSIVDNIIVDLKNNFNGEFTCTIDDQYYAKGSFVNGIATIPLLNAPFGIHHIYVDYEYEKDAHDFFSFYATVKKDPKLSVNVKNITVGEALEISINALVETGNVTVNLNNIDYDLKVVNGKAKLSVPNLTAGKYTLSVKYSGNAEFAKNSLKTNIVVSKLSPNLQVQVINIAVGETESIKISANNKANGKLLIQVNNNQYTLDLINGYGILTLSKLSAGEYDVNVIYQDDAYFSNQSVSVKFTVRQLFDSKIVAKDISMLYSSKSKYSVTVYGTDGKVASDVEVIFKISAKQVAKVKTNANGVASYVVTKNPGKYKIQATALGKSVTKTLTVKHIVTLKTATLKKSAKKLTLQAALAKINGKYLDKKTITFKINGKKVATAKTNSKGVAKIIIKNPNVVKKLKVGKKVTYQATYLKDTVKKTAKIKK